MGKLSQEGLMNIRRAKRGRQWGQVNDHELAPTKAIPGPGAAGAVTVYDGEGNITGYIDPITRVVTEV